MLLACVDQCPDKDGQPHLRLLKGPRVPNLLPRRALRLGDTVISHSQSISSSSGWEVTVRSEPCLGVMETARQEGPAWAWGEVGRPARPHCTHFSAPGLCDSLQEEFIPFPLSLPTRVEDCLSGEACTLPPARIVTVQLDVTLQGPLDTRPPSPTAPPRGLAVSPPPPKPLPGSQQKDWQLKLGSGL